MPDAPPTGDGPWGEALRYWLRKRRLTNTEVAAGTGMTLNTVGTIARGLPTQTTKLADIATFLQVPLTAVLVSPLQHLTADTKRQLIREAVDNALRSIEQLDTTTLDWARRIQGLKGTFRQTAIDAIRNMEEAQRNQRSKRRPPRKKR